MTSREDETVKILQGLTKVLDLDLKDESSQILLFFGAEWHVWTRQTLLEKLVKAYNLLKKRDGSKIEFIYVSSDKTMEEYERFSKKMPWPKIPYTDESTRHALIRLYAPPKSKCGHPIVTVLGHGGRKVITRNAVSKLVSQEEDGSGFPWETSAAEIAATSAATLVFCTVL